MDLPTRDMQIDFTSAHLLLAQFRETLQHHPGLLHSNMSQTEVSMILEKVYVPFEQETFIASAIRTNADMLHFLEHLSNR
jgi:hypothetical protein